MGLGVNPVCPGVVPMRPGFLLVQPSVVLVQPCFVLSHPDYVMVCSACLITVLLPCLSYQCGPADQSLAALTPCCPHSLLPSLLPPSLLPPSLLSAITPCCLHSQLSSDHSPHRWASLSRQIRDSLYWPTLVGSMGYICPHPFCASTPCTV